MGSSNRDLEKNGKEHFIQGAVQGMEAEPITLEHALAVVEH